MVDEWNLNELTKGVRTSGAGGGAIVCARCETEWGDPRGRPTSSDRKLDIIIVRAPVKSALNIEPAIVVREVWVMAINYHL